MKKKIKFIIIFSMLILSFNYKNIIAHEKISEKERIKQAGGIENLNKNKIKDRQKENELKKMKQKNDLILYSFRLGPVYPDWLKNGKYKNDGKEVRFYDLPSYEQETLYYCGPASVQLAMLLLTGKTKSQKEYAKMLGTTEPDGTYVYKIAEVLNQAKKNDYGWREIGDDYSRFWEPVVKNLSEEKIPLIAKIYTNHLKIYKNNRYDHYLTITGYYETGNNKTRKIYYFDSFKCPKVGNANFGHHEATLEEFMNGTTYLIW